MKLEYMYRHILLHMYIQSSLFTQLHMDTHNNNIIEHIDIHSPIPPPPWGYEPKRKESMYALIFSKSVCECVCVCVCVSVCRMDGWLGGR